MDYSGQAGFGSSGAGAGLGMGLGSLPLPPVPYEDFQYSFPALSSFENPFTTQPADGNGAGPSSWVHSPPPPTFSMPNSPQMTSFTGREGDALQSGMLPSQVFGVPHAMDADVQPGRTAPGINPTLLQPSNFQKPPTPAPLFSETDHALFSSFLSSFASSSDPTFGGGPSAGWEFNPQGMPPDMPVLEELKRRLEAENEGGIVEGWVGRGEADAVGRDISDRLRLDSGPSMRGKEDDGSAKNGGGRKKARTATGAAESPADGDVEMSHAGWEDVPDVPPATGRAKPRRPSNRSTKRPSPPTVPITPSSTNAPQPSVAARQQPSRLSPTEPSASSSPQQPSTGGGAQPRPHHLLSEQKRRSAIQGGFGALVELIRSNEPLSGISIGTSDTPALPLPGTNPASSQNGVEGLSASNGKKGKGAAGEKGGKQAGRGRGRRGEVDTGASKSVVLERAVEYVKWMQNGNKALRLEVERVEGILHSQGFATS